MVPAVRPAAAFRVVVVLLASAASAYARDATSSTDCVLSVAIGNAKDGGEDAADDKARPGMVAGLVFLGVVQLALRVSGSAKPSCARSPADSLRIAGATAALG